MRRVGLVLAIGILLLSACRGTRRRPRATPRVQPVAQPMVQHAVEPEVETTRLRYFDVKDFPIRNGIMIVRGTPAQLRAIDGHLGGIRRVLAEPGAARPAGSWTPVKSREPNVVVQVHSVADILEHRSGDDLRALVLRELGPEQASTAQLEVQGRSALILKAPPATQDRVAAILDELRGSLR